MNLFIQKLRQLQKEPFYFDEETDISEIAQLDNDIRRIEPVQVNGYAVMDGDEITCELNIQGTMILPCARTLVDVPYDFSIKDIEYFTLTAYREEDDVHLVNGEVLDLTPYIKENVLLEIPIRVFADQKTLEANTISEGDGWTLITEDEKTEKIDPRLEKLQSLLNEDNNKDSKE